MDIVVKLNEQTAGRDKIIRLLQYGSRACWYYTQKTNSSQHSMDVLRSLEYTFSSFRKLLRLGRCLDSLYSAIKLMNYPDLTVRVTLMLSKIAHSLFLLADHIIWISRVGVMRVNIEKWNTIANKYWLMTIIMNLSRDLYEIVRLLESEGKYVLSKANVVTNMKFIRHCGTICLRDHRDLVMDAFKNGCDLFIPLTALGFTKFSPGAVGLLGLASSAIGLYTLIYPFYKLNPS